MYGLLLLFAFYLVYFVQGLIKSNVLDIEHSVILLFSNESDSSLEPPYCDIVLINKEGLVKITDDSYYDNSISYAPRENAIYFESKRKKPELGLSQASEIYSYDLNTRSKTRYAEKLDIPDLKEPVISTNNPSLLAFSISKLDTFYVNVYDLAKETMMFGLGFDSLSIVDYFLVDPFLVVYNYSVAVSDPSKLQIFNVRSNDEIETGQLVGKSIIHMSNNGRLYLQEKGADGTLNISEFNPKTGELVKLMDVSLDNYNDFDIKYIISQNEWLGIKYDDGSNTLFYWNNGDVEEMFSAQCIEQVVLLDPQ